MAPSTAGADAKRAAIEQWNADPCGPSADAEPGSAEYARSLLAGRRRDAGWLREALGYDETAGLRVLDIGCGQGIDLMEYALAGADATGIDLTPRHVKLAEAHIAAMELDADVVRGDAEALPFGEASFDRVSSNGVLHHTPDMPAALREALRVLRPGGEARIIVYNRLSLHYWTRQVLLEGIARGGIVRERGMAGVLSAGVERSSIDARPLVRVYSPRQLARVLRNAGFTDVEVIVRHLLADDAPLVGRLSDAARERLSRRAGWYVVGRGRRPGA